MKFSEFLLKEEINNGESDFIKKYSDIILNLIKKDNNLLINNMSDIMIELRDGKYRLNCQAIGHDMFNTAAGYQFLQGQVDDRDIYSKTIAEADEQWSTEWAPIPAYWN